MYHAKQQGRNRYQFFAQYMNEIATKRLVLEGKLRRAIDSGQLRLHYQPKIELATGRVVGLEALARWREPELGSISPDEFVPLAEESGLIHGMGDWVLRTAIAQLSEWQGADQPPLRVAVNLSAQQLQRPGLVERISSLLEDADVAPEWLEVEITESVLLEDEEGVIAILEALRSLGVHVSLDDFGTGYSSLSYLRRLPIDTVKIDQSFVRAVEEEAEDAAITQAMISLVKVLHLRVVVEGVETEAQRTFLHEVGCDEIQGFLVSAPVAPEEVSQVVETLHRKKRLRRRRRK
jgi:EAL domain-containing protein (putative c-di-GMP-specific phosphodiesterase class I)